MLRGLERHIAVYHAALWCSIKPFPQYVLFPRSYGCLRMLHVICFDGWSGAIHAQSCFQLAWRRNPSALLTRCVFNSPDVVTHQRYSHIVFSTRLMFQLVSATHASAIRGTLFLPSTATRRNHPQAVGFISASFMESTLQKYWQGAPREGVNPSLPN